MQSFAICGPSIKSLAIQDLILNFWFPNCNYQDFWFDQSRDEYIKHKFFKILEDAETGIYNDMTTTLDGKLALIILFDQFTRNIFRGTTEYNKNDTISCSLAKEIIDSDDDIKMPAHKQMFVLLPFRHKKTTTDLMFVMEKIKIYLSLTENPNDKILLNRFMNATIRDLSKMTDRIKFYSERCDHPEYDSIILDDLCKSYDYDILSTNIMTLKNDTIDKTDLYISVFNFVKNNNLIGKNIGVSLSGGVDSMVLLYILTQIKLRGVIKDIVCVHINYKNRSESDKETDFIMKFSLCLNIPIYIREIDHIKRSDDIDRDLYERETRNIRFNLYKYAIKKHNLAGMCLGHHKDDLSENVLMNILNGKDLLELYNMYETSVIDSVLICRPMITHHKKSIYDIAHNNMISYMKDTTPISSFRGLLRTTIFPALDKFSSSAKDGIITIGEYSKEWNDIINKMIIKPIVSSIIDGKLGFSVPITESIIELPMVFWMKIFIIIFHKRHYSMITRKNMGEFTRWIKRNNNSILQLTNGLICIYKNNALHFLKKDVIVENYDPIDKVEINSDIEKSITLKAGIWEINLSIVDESVKMRDRITMNQLINGTFKYTEAICNDCVFIKYSCGKNDTTKKIFSDINPIGKHMPKITSGLITTPNKYLLVTYNYKI